MTPGLVLGGSLGDFLATFWRLLGDLGAPLGSLWLSLGASGLFFYSLWVLLGSLGLSLDPSRCFLVVFVRISSTFLEFSLLCLLFSGVLGFLEFFVCSLFLSRFLGCGVVWLWCGVV